MTALALTLSKWCDSKEILIDVEGHGREESIGNNINLARTVGWFTSCYPAFINIDDSSDLRASLEKVSEELANIPNKGIGYGILRYLSADKKIRSSLEQLPKAEVALNYTGNNSRDNSRDLAKDQSTNSGRPIGQIALSQGKNRKRMHRFEIVSGIANGELTVRWGYSRDDYDDETIKKLCDVFLRTVYDLTK